MRVTKRQVARLGLVYALIALIVLPGAATGPLARAITRTSLTPNVSATLPGLPVEWGDGSATPLLVNGLSGVVAMAAGGQHSLALKSDGTVWAWGYNYYGQLGTGNTGSPSMSSPAQVSGLSGVIAIAAGQYHSLALKADGTVWAWGSNNDDQLGTTASGSCYTYSSGPCSATPVQVPITNVVAIAAGQYHNLALRSDGTVWAWGYNSDGELGTGNAGSPSATPARVLGLTKAV